jgi:hypothetical protein
MTAIISLTLFCLYAVYVDRKYESGWLVGRIWPTRPRHRPINREIVINRKKLISTQLKQVREYARIHCVFYYVHVR